MTEPTAPDPHDNHTIEGDGTSAGLDRLRALLETPGLVGPAEAREAIKDWKT